MPRKRSHVRKTAKVGKTRATAKVPRKGSQSRTAKFKFSRGKSAGKQRKRGK